MEDMSISTGAPGPYSGGLPRGSETSPPPALMPALEQAAGSVHAGHTVQFYDDDAFLVPAVAEFLATGIRAGDASLVIATAAHRQAFAQQLLQQGVDVLGARRSGLLSMVDARRTVSSFMVAGMPDAERFAATIGPLIERDGERNGSTRSGGLRAYGEMVDLLWRDGNAPAALRLEELWNELSASHDFLLLCSYSMSGFGQAEDGAGFREIIGQHGQVIPTERYTGLENDERLGEISRLQQRALALESEIERREGVEQRLRDALAAREEFLSIASHELRNPIATIFGTTQLMGRALKRGSLDAQRIAQYSGVLESSSAQLARMTDDLLDVARLERGSVDLRMQRIDLAALVADVVSRQPWLNHPVQLHVESAPLWAVADADRIEQVISNLLDNGLKYSPEGRPIHVTVRRDGANALVEVTDEGIGLPPGFEEKIFTPFGRAMNAVEGNIPGLGLGLYLSRGIARQHDGDLSAHSPGPGEGTTILLTLPCDDRPDAAADR